MTAVVDEDKGTVRLSFDSALQPELAAKICRRFIQAIGFSP